MSQAQSRRQHLLLGTWTLSVDRSRFDVNHQPKAGRMRVEMDGDGSIVMNAEGGLTVRTESPDTHTLRTECRRENGTLVGAGSFVVSADGRSLSATTSGWDTQLREFKQTTVWDREN